MGRLWGKEEVVGIVEYEEKSGESLQNIKFHKATGKPEENQIILRRGRWKEEREKQIEWEGKRGGEIEMERIKNQILKLSEFIYINVWFNCKKIYSFYFLTFLLSLFLSPTLHHFYLGFYLWLNCLKVSIAFRPWNRGNQVNCISREMKEANINFRSVASLESDDQKQTYLKCENVRLFPHPFGFF